MEVTRENFADIYPLLKEKIFSASFISFDEEMSGIWTTDNNSRNKKSDNPENRYAKMAPTATKYSIIQFGLCLFHEECGHDGVKKLIASPYCFYTFPDSGQDISMSTSAIDFLRKNGMDFGKWISNGVTYVNAREEQWLRKRHLEPLEKKESSDVPAPPASSSIVLTKQNDIDFLAQNVAKLNEFLANDEATEFTFDGCNNFLKKALYQHMEAHHPSLTLSKSADNRLSVLKMSEAEKELHRKKVADEAMKSFEKAMGFRLVFNDLVEAKKPIIGHNLMFDLLFMMKSFDGSLAEDLGGFKDRLHALFPEIYDTKYIASSGVLGTAYEETALNEIYDKLVLKYQDSESSAAIAGASSSSAAATTTATTVTESASDAIRRLVDFAPGFNQFDNSSGNFFHNAGYDAFCTGAVFCRELKMIGGIDALRAVANKKLFMMQSLFHMDLHPEKPHGWIKVPGTLLYVAKFSGDTKTEAIVNTFTSAGYPLTSIEVHWIDGESTFVSVNTADGPETVIPSLKFPADWEIISYEDYELRRQEKEEAAKKAKEAEAAHASASPSGADGSSLVKMVDSTVNWLVHIKDTIVDTVVGLKRGHAADDTNTASPAKAAAAAETGGAAAVAGAESAGTGTDSSPVVANPPAAEAQSTAADTDSCPKKKTKSN